MMNWKFWQKKSAEASSPSAPVKLPGPKSIPEPVGRYLVVRLKKDPDWVWRLEAVVRPRLGEKYAFDVRVFDRNQITSGHGSIKNFNSMDAHPELILFEGWYNKRTMAVEINANEKQQAVAV